VYGVVELIAKAVGLAARNDGRSLFGGMSRAIFHMTNEQTFT
jgi:hypothetical protein